MRNLYFLRNTLEMIGSYIKQILDSNYFNVNRVCIKKCKKYIQISCIKI